MNWKQVEIKKVTPKQIITKKVLFPENSVYFTICKEIEEMERKESLGSQNQSGRKSSRRK